ncbi:hypothetical protein Tco_0360643 [Tanacetum coccineum]
MARHGTWWGRVGKVTIERLDGGQGAEVLVDIVECLVGLGEGQRSRMVCGVRAKGGREGWGRSTQRIGRGGWGVMGDLEVVGGRRCFWSERAVLVLVAVVWVRWGLRGLVLWGA